MIEAGRMEPPGDIGHLNDQAMQGGGPLQGAGSRERGGGSGERERGAGSGERELGVGSLERGAWSGEGLWRGGNRR